MRTQRCLWIAVGLVACLGGAPAAAGEIEPAFAMKLERSAADQLHPAIVMMADQVDLPSLDRRLARMGATRPFRHEVVVTRLREKARVTQAGVRALLEAHVHAGFARDVEPMWLVNAVLVKATAASLVLVAQCDEVGIVYDGSWPIELIHPVDEGPSYAGLDATEPGIVDIRAPDLWSLGYEGQGVLVSNIDTGVYYDHESLKARWRGNDPGVTVAEAWHDPVTSHPLPRDLNGHGTHTMGTICGAGGIGVAPQAKWIASATIDRVSITRTVQDALLSLQWVADPDQDPKTVRDVPAVCSNSWGLSPLISTHGVAKCSPTFWSAIDNAEYAGVAVVFAAGNEGARGAESLRTPADRIASPVHVLAVGALSTVTTAIASFSSRGPSGCDKVTVKPDVCARGQSVRSASRSGTASYTTKSGTSMACPHVAGVLALLHQVWPDATPTELKTALLATCDDLGASGDDNVFGMGRINCLSAYTELIRQRPDVSASVQGTVHQYREGQTFYGLVVLTSHLKAAETVQVALQFYFRGQPTSLLIVPPGNLRVAAGYSNAAFPILVALVIPTGLPAEVLEPGEWSLRATIRKAGGGALIHMAEYPFVI
ncbi:MAG: S8 family serine peptidase, partial [Planctomycetes bacterium]|nr:S8 family serine peptidase [Planctomycetota bacterium]